MNKELGGWVKIKCLCACSHISPGKQLILFSGGTFWASQLPLVWTGSPPPPPPPPYNSLWFNLKLSGLNPSLQTAARGGGPSLWSHGRHGDDPMSPEEKCSRQTVTRKTLKRFRDVKWAKILRNCLLLEFLKVTFTGSRTNYSWVLPNEPQCFLLNMSEYTKQTATTVSPVSLRICNALFDSINTHFIKPRRLKSLLLV